MDFSKICRACSNERHILIKIFASDHDDELTLGEMLNKCTKLNIREEDKFPQNICYSCAKQLETSFKFIKMCLESDASFKGTIPKDINLPEHSPSPTNLGKNDEDGIHYELIYISKDEESDSAEIDGCSPEILLTSDGLNSLSDIPLEVLNNDDSLPESVELKRKKDVSIENNPDDQKFYRCDNCNKSFFTERALELHMKALHRLLNKNSESAVDNENEQHGIELPLEEKYNQAKTKLKNSDDKFTCEICGRRLQDENKLQTHMKVHSEDDKHFKCEVCGKNFTEERYLQRHALYHQSVVFICTEKGCNQKYTMKYKYVDHLRRHHRKILTNCEVRKLQSTKFQGKK